MANCSNIKTGRSPLFPGIMVTMTVAHLHAGMEAARAIMDMDGKPVVLFVGMSNWNQEIKALLRLFKAAGIRHIVWHNAGRGAWDLARMVKEADEYWAWVKQGMVKKGIPAENVQVLFIKNSVKGGTTPAAYEQLMNEHIDRAVTEFPKLRQVFLASAVYSGYSSKTVTRSEPGAYLEGFAVNNVISGRIGQTPWVGWCAYLWADGTNPRADGLVWKCQDFEFDGVHPGPLGEAKVAEMMYRFMENSPVTEWFKEQGNE